MATAAIQADREWAIRARKICVLMTFSPTWRDHARNGGRAEIRQ
jgi:hypothetical protein